MSPVIRISDETFSLLQKVSQPLIDTPDSAIRRVLDAYFQMEPSGSKNVVSTKSVEHVDKLNNAPRIFDPDSPPDFTHSSFLTGGIAGVIVGKWNHLLIEAHAQAYKALNKDFEMLQRISEANLKKGNFSDTGFKPVGNFGFSIQGVEANKAWLIALKLAKRFHFPIYAEFRWQTKAGIAYPGDLGQISWYPDVKEFSASIGGGLLGPRYEITLVKPNTFRYKAEDGDKKKIDEEISVSDELMAQTINSLMRANCFKWKSRYVDEHVMDGTTWAINLEIPGNAISIYGVNAYPPKKEFEEFLKAISNLTGGRNFE